MKKLTFLMLSLILILVVPVQSFAYNNGNKFTVEVNPKSVPENTAFVDILVKLDTDSKNYIDQNLQKISTLNSGDIFISKDSEIVSYYEDGFVSYLFHFNGANVENQIEYHKFLFNNLSSIQKCKSVKVAFVDEYGQIIKITDEVALQNTVFAETDILAVEVETIQAKIAFYPLVAVACLVPVLLFICGMIDLIVRHEAKREKERLKQEKERLKKENAKQ